MSFARTTGAVLTYHGIKQGNSSLFKFLHTWAFLKRLWMVRDTGVTVQVPMCLHFRCCLCGVIKCFLTSSHSFLFICTEDFWVGGTDVITEGDWIWVLSQTPIIYYSHWAHYEPNNLGGSENCLEISYGHHYFWNDDSCSRAEFFICEQP